MAGVGTGDSIAVAKLFPNNPYTTGSEIEITLIMPAMEDRTHRPS